MAKIQLILDQKVRLPLPELQSALTQEACLELTETLTQALTIANPAYLRQLKFSRGGRYQRKEPSHFCFLHLRKPKTNPYLEMPIGFLFDLVQILRSYGIRTEVDDRLCTRPQSFVSPGIKLREYQTRALQALLSRHRGVLVAPCGAGKTIMSLALAADRAQTTLVLVHTLDLLKQWRQSAREFLQEDCGEIGGGKKSTEGKIIIATVQTLIRDRALIQRLSELCGTVIIDECHHTPASTFTKVISLLKPRFMYGVSATPEREDGLQDVMHFFIGPELHRISTRELQRQNHLMRPRFVPIQTGFFYPFDREDPESYGEMIQQLISNEERNQLIVDALLQNRQRINLVLSTRIEHLQVLNQILEKHLPKEQIALVTGQTPKLDRERLLDACRNGQIPFLLATQLADEGLDIRCLENLFLVTPTRNSSRIQQRVGRIMRLHELKHPPVVYDFVDVRTKVLLSQYRSRYNTVYRHILDLENQPNCQSDLAADSKML